MAEVVQLVGLGPVKVCTQCFWGQTEVWATFNDTDGVALVFLEDNRATDEQAADDAVLDLHKYGKVIISKAKPVFAFKTRRRDRSVVYVNICSCEDVPCNEDKNLISIHRHSSVQNLTSPDSADGQAGEGLTMHAIYMVSAPRRDVERSVAQPQNSHQRRAPDSVFHVAVSPRVISEAKKDVTGKKKSMICEQALEFLSAKCGEDEFTHFQYVEEVVEGDADADVTVSWKVVYRYVTEESVQSGAVGVVSKVADSTTTESPVPSVSMAVPAEGAFKKYLQIPCSPEDATDRPPRAENDPHNERDIPLLVKTTASNSITHSHSDTKKSDTKSHSLSLPPSSDDGKVMPVSAATDDDGSSEDGDYDEVSNTDELPLTVFTTRAKTKSITFTGQPGFVIKTRRGEDHVNTQVVKSTRGGGGGGGTHHGFLSSPAIERARQAAVMRVKVFINVLHNGQMEDPMHVGSVALRHCDAPLVAVAQKVQQTTDAKGELSLLYTVAVGSEYFKPNQDEDSLNITSKIAIQKIINAVNRKHVDCLSDENYSLPCVRNSHKGDPIGLMTYSIAVDKVSRTSTPTPSEGAASIKQNVSFGDAADIGKDNNTKSNASIMLIEGEYDDSNSDGSESETQKYGAAAHELNEDTTRESMNMAAESTLVRPMARRATILSGIFSPPVSEPTVRNVGRELITSEDMLEYVASLSLEEAGAKLLKQASAKDASVLLGWQVIFPNEAGDKGDNKLGVDIRVVTGMRKSALRKTEYRISGKHVDDHWTLLKRSGSKAGVVFWPLRKVLFLEEPVDALPTTSGDKGHEKQLNKKRHSMF